MSLTAVLQRPTDISFLPEPHADANCGPDSEAQLWATQRTPSQEGLKISRIDGRSHVQGGEGQGTEYPQAGETAGIEHRLHEMMNCLARARKQKQLRPQRGTAAAGAGRSQ